MATATEIQSLENIHYKSKIKVFLYPILVLFLFTIAFLNFYPIGTELKSFLKKNLKNTGCNPDYDQIRIEWLLPKVIVSDLVLPASCFGKEGEPFKFSFVNINFQLINFSPLGIPFRIDTEINAQPITAYFVQGFGERLIRLKDQAIVLGRLESLMGKFKMNGSLKLDLKLLVDNNQRIKSLSFKAQSKDFKIPSQSVQDFTIPNLKVNDLDIEANSDVPPVITVDKMIIGDIESPVRANFKGTVDLQEGAVPFSPIKLAGEIRFSESLKAQLPLIDMMFQSFTQKDGFYQILLGGTLGAPKPAKP